MNLQTRFASVTRQSLAAALAVAALTVSTQALAEPPNTFPNGGFEAGDAGGWFIGGSGGIDRGLGYAYSGRNNGFVRASRGWNAVNHWASVRPYTKYYLTARVRVSSTLTGGYLSVRGRQETGFQILNEQQLRQSDCGYQYYSYSFFTGPNDAILFYAGMWGNGRDAWLQVDDVTLQVDDGSIEKIGVICQR